MSPGDDMVNVVTFCFELGSENGRRTLLRQRHYALKPIGSFAEGFQPSFKGFNDMRQNTYSPAEFPRGIVEIGRIGNRQLVVYDIYVIRDQIANGYRQLESCVPNLGVCSIDFPDFEVMPDLILQRHFFGIILSVIRDVSLNFVI